MDHSSIYVKESGWIDAHALCQVLIDLPHITVISETNINQIEYKEDVWQAGEHSAPVLIIASGFKANQFDPCTFLKIKPIRGQTTSIRANEHTSSLKIPVCAGVHVIPAANGMHSIGATYHSEVDKDNIEFEDDLMNLQKLKQLTTQEIWSNQIESNWAGVRAATRDYLPLVGPVPKEKNFKACYQGLASNSNRWIPKLSDYHPGLFICSAFGSRGLTTIPLSAEWLAGHINKEPSFLPRDLVQAISPARFLRKEIIRG